MYRQTIVTTALSPCTSIPVPRSRRVVRERGPSRFRVAQSPVSHDVWLAADAGKAMIPNITAMGTAAGAVLCSAPAGLPRYARLPQVSWGTRFATGGMRGLRRAEP